MTTDTAPILDTIDQQESDSGAYEFDILHLTSAHEPRDNRIFERECVALAAHGYRVGLVVPHNRDEVISGVRILAVKKPARRSLRLTMTPLAVLREALRRKARVYHFHDAELLPVGLFLRLLGRKVVYDAHEIHPSSLLYSPSIPRYLRRSCSRFFALLEQVSAKHWSAVICAKDEIARHLAEFGCEPVSIGNFADLSELPVPQTDTARYASGQIVNFGGIEARTCILPIVKALALLPDSVRAKLVLGGKCHSAALQQQASTLPGWERVDYRGQLSREQMVQVLHGAGVALVLYKPEPNNYSVGSNRFYEAMAAGLPVITSDFPNWKAIVERFSCGLTVDSEDPRSIADALEYLLSRPNEARRLGENGRRAALYQCNWAKEKTKLVQLYEQLLTQPKNLSAPAAEAVPPRSAWPRDSELGGEVRHLHPTEYAEWDALVKSSPQGSVFCRSWWLQALGPGVRILGYFENGQLIAGMPLYYKKRSGVTLCTMPRLTQTWGPVLRLQSGKTVNTASYEMRIAKIFSEHLAREKFFLQVFHPRFQHWLPFLWGGFKQTLGCTYVLDDLADRDALWQNLGGNTRNKIRKTLKEGLSVRSCGIDVVFDCVRKSFDRQQKSQPYSGEFIASLYRAARQNDAGECFACYDAAGTLHAASFLVWDEKAVHYLAGGADPQLRNSGAQSLLVWHGIQFAAEHSHSFDFCGSVLEPIEHFVRGFGAKQVPYSQITKMPALFRLFAN